jgi:hypothetical protein
MLIINTTNNTNNDDLFYFCEECVKFMHATQKLKFIDACNSRMYFSIYATQLIYILIKNMEAKCFIAYHPIIYM